MATRMQQRRGTAEQWTIINPVLAEGEIGFESDTNQFKLGDGVNTWDNLSYFVNEDAFAVSLGDYVELSLLGVPDGVATLDENGFVPAEQLDIDLSPYYTSTEVDDLIGDATVDGTAGNTITDRISTAVSDLVGAAPEALNTLEELASALDNDADFATTVVNALAAQNELSELEDVAIATPVNGDALIYDGTAWKNQKLSVDPNPQIFMLMGA